VPAERNFKSAGRGYDTSDPLQRHRAGLLPAQSGEAVSAVGQAGGLPYPSPRVIDRGDTSKFRLRPLLLMQHPLDEKLRGIQRENLLRYAKKSAPKRRFSLV